MNIVFLCSGGGGNLRFLQEWAVARPDADLVIGGVLADRLCGGVEYAEARGIPNGILKSDWDDDDSVFRCLDEFGPDLIVTNVHKILSASVVSRYSDRLVNLHYSLLPLYGGSIGATPVRQAIEDGCKFVGTTVHRVVEEVDAGPIISQSLLEVRPEEPFDELMDRVFRSGCLNLLNAVMLHRGEAVAATGRIDEALVAPVSGDVKEWRLDESFWGRVRG